MTDGIKIGNRDTEGFHIRYKDGTETVIPCQQAWLTQPFVCFIRVDEAWSNESVALAVSAASIRSITPVYRGGSADAKRQAEALPKSGD